MRLSSLQKKGVGSSFWRALLELKWRFPVKAIGIPRMRPACCFLHWRSNKMYRSRNAQKHISLYLWSKSEQLASKCHCWANVDHNPTINESLDLLLYLATSHFPGWVQGSFAWSQAKLALTKARGGNGTWASDLHIWRGNSGFSLPWDLEQALSHQYILFWEVYPALGVKIIFTFLGYTTMRNGFF